jgi:hypothetical protein
MTQGPPSGQAAPLATEFGSDGGGRRSATEAPAGTGGPQESGSGGPSPSNPTTSTPWGSTSTAAGSGSAPYGSNSGPNWSSTPLGQAYSEAPTGAVPLVQGTAAPRTTGAPPNLPPPPMPNPAASQAGRGASHSAASSRSRGPRRARLQLRHVNPWTVLKFSCVLSIALFFVWLIVIGVLFGVLDGAGVIGKINDAYTTIQGGNTSAPVTAGVVFGGAAIIGVVNIVLFIALSTVGSVVYNLCADLVGGIEITLSER